MKTKTMIDFVSHQEERSRMATERLIREMNRLRARVQGGS